MTEKQFEKELNRVFNLGHISGLERASNELRKVAEKLYGLGSDEQAELARNWSLMFSEMAEVDEKLHRDRYGCKGSPR